MPKFFRTVVRPFKAIRPIKAVKGIVANDTVAVKSAHWSRWLALACFFISPFVLVYQLAEWVQLGFWYDVSIGSMIFTDPVTAKQFNGAGGMNILGDMLWIPLWFEFVAAGVLLFVLHMILWNRMDAKQSSRRRARRSSGYGGSRRRES